MNIGIDISAALNERINDALMDMKPGDNKTTQFHRDLVELCNKHGMYGLKAMEFLSELAEIVMKGSKK